MDWFKSVLGRARKFAAVDWQTKGLVLRAFVLLWLVRIGLWVAPFRWVQSVTRCLGRTKKHRSQPRYLAGEITELVSRCALYVPKANCLPQAMTLDVLLRREGYAPTLQIGVARGAQGEFLAHAWVEVAGESYSSGNEITGRFTALPTAFG